MLGVGGQFNKSGKENFTSNFNDEKARGSKRAGTETPFGNLAGFLMQGRRSKGEQGGDLRGELELLSGVIRPDSDNAEQLANRFKITYDTRTKQGPKKTQSANRGQTTRATVGFRSKNPTNYLYGKVGQKSTTWWGKFG